MSSIRLISDDVNIHFSNLDHTELIQENNYILRFPAGKFALLCFASHKDSSKKIHPYVAEAIKANIGIVYVCEALPEDKIIDDHIVYIECPYRWYIHTLFMNPLQFRAVFSDDHSERLARAFSEFTKYTIPKLKNQNALQDLIARSEADKDNVLVEITGGVGDHLMVIPTLKTLAENGKRVFILCERHRMDCFSNLYYIAGIFTDRKQVDVSHFEKITLLHFGEILNDYRSELNKQNRIFSVAALCGVDKSELVLKRPEIIFSDDEINKARQMWGTYPNKIFFGFDSDRADAKMSESMAREKINALKMQGFTVFTSSRRKYNLQNCIDLSQKLTIRELFALIAVMDFVITIDTAFLHIAGALEKKTFALMNFFDPTWRCSTYKNCHPLTPQVSCFPCVARQFVPRSEWKCNDRSCYTNFDWEGLYRELKQLKLKMKPSHKVPEEIHAIPEAISSIPVDGQIPERPIVIYDNDGLGDILMLTPAIEALSRKGFVLDVVTRFPEIFMNLPFVRRSLPYGTMVQNREQYHRKIELSYKLSQYEFEWCRQHRVLATAHLLNLTAKDLMDIRPIIQLSPEEISLVDKFIQTDKKILCCGFTSADIRREYPREARQDFIDSFKVAFPGVEIILVGDTTRDEKWMVKTQGVKKPLIYKNCVDARGKTSIRELFSIVNRSDYCFSIDSAVLHIAGAFKKPTLFMPSSIKGEWRSYPETVICSPNKSCYPCNERNCQCAQMAECMSNFSKDVLITKFKEMIP